MKTTIEFKNKTLIVDLSKPLDISIPLRGTSHNPTAWNSLKPQITPVITENWIGKVSKGASVNFNNINFNPHAHGTHTECLGHITSKFYSINNCLKTFFFEAELISIEPQFFNNDFVINKIQIQKKIEGKTPEALIIRTLPNKIDKKNKQYTNTNPAYLSKESAEYICKIGVKHLLIDLPSVDKEQDEGKLLAHKAFWNIKNIDKCDEDTRKEATITEMIFVPNSIVDGSYLLNLQMAAFENDASPSKPILYKIKKEVL